MVSNNFDYINNYYYFKGKNVLTTDSLSSIFHILFAKKNDVIISDSKVLQGLAKLKQIERDRYEDAERLAIRFFALRDALILLAQKRVPVFFYNRIGKEKKDYKYTEKETQRMQKDLSFPKMYEDIDKYEQEFRDIFGNKYTKEYVAEIGKIPQVIKVGNLYQHENYCSRYINVINGKRITCNQPENAKRTIHVYGRCGAFGYAVEDKDTIPSLLQRELLDHGVSDVCVINHGLWGGEDDYLDHNFLQESLGMKQGDIILFYRKHFDKELLKELEKCGLIYKELTHEWHQQRNNLVTFYNKPGHMNADGYKLVAKLICDDLISKEFSCGPVASEYFTTSAEHLKNYLKSSRNEHFEKEIREFIDDINAHYPLSEKMINNGAIVMNCNPFTRGHRYLIDTAAKQVDRLYIFVVEEDKSYFKFTDRFEMVRRGTEDIENVEIVPSGKFIISAYTFPEYFMKDYVKEKNFDVSMDVETFCKYIASPLRIKKRFAGEEPFDPVTKNYNENMAKILPEYGIEFIVIPRMKSEKGRTINATSVRELLEKKETDALLEYVPESTKEILIKKYMK